MATIKPFKRPIGPPAAPKPPATMLAEIGPNCTLITVHGYITYITALAKVFNISTGTLRNRVNAGWPIDAALIAAPQSHWNVSTASHLQAEPWVADAVKARLAEVYGELDND